MATQRSTPETTTATQERKPMSTNENNSDSFGDIAADLLKSAEAEDPDAATVVEPEAETTAETTVTPETTAAATTAETTVETTTETAAEATDENTGYNEFEDQMPKPAAAKPAAQATPASETTAEVPSNDLDDLMKDPFLASLIEAKRKGLSPYDVAQQAKSVDFSKVSPEEKIRMDCERLGITDPKLIEKEIDVYNDLSPRQQQSELNKITEQLESDQKSRMEKIVSKSSDQNERVSNIMTQFNTGVKTMCKEAIGKEFYGLTVDQKTASDMENLLLNNWDLFSKDGTINVAKACSYALYDLRLRKLIKEQRKSGTHAGRGEILNDVTQPDKNNRSASNRNTETQDVSEEALVRGFVDANS